MNRAQRRQRQQRQARGELEDICIYCQLADGTMTAEDFEWHCREVVHTAGGLTVLDEIAHELQQHPRIEPALVDECVRIAFDVRLAHRARAGFLFHRTHLKFTS